MPAAKLKEFLDGRGTKYVVITHSPAFTAQEVAAAAHISGKDMAKVVVVKLDGSMALAVLRACDDLDFGLLQQATGAGSAELANESEFADRFPGCEVGAMPPFGILFGMDTVVDVALAEDEAIAFNAGSHKELVQLAYGDFEDVVGPRVAPIARRR